MPKRKEINLKNSFTTSTYHLIYFDDNTYGKFKHSKCKLITNDSVEIGYGGSKCRGSIRYSGTLEEVDGYINNNEVDLSCSGSDTEAEEPIEPKVCAKRGLTKRKQSSKENLTETESENELEDITAKKSKITPIPRRGNVTQQCSQQPLVLQDRTNQLNNTTQPNHSSQREELNSQPNNSTQPNELIQSSQPIRVINNPTQNQLSQEAILVIFRTTNFNICNLFIC